MDPLNLTHFLSDISEAAIGELSCPQGIHSVTEETLQNSALLDASFTKPLKVETGELLSLSDESPAGYIPRCCTPLSRIKTIVEVSNESLSPKLHSCTHITLDSLCDVLREDLQHVTPSFVIPGNLSKTKVNSLYRVLLMGVRPFTSSMKNSKIELANWVFLRYMEGEQIQKDNLTQFSIPTRFQLIDPTTGKVQQEFSHLCCYPINLIYIDPCEKQPLWITQFLNRTFKLGKYWCCGESHLMLVPFFDCTNIRLFSNIPTKIIPFSMTLIGFNVYAGLAFLQHAIPFWNFCLTRMCQKEYPTKISIDPGITDYSIIHKIAEQLHQQSGFIEFLFTFISWNVSSAKLRDLSLEYFANLSKAIRNFHLIFGKLILPPNAPAFTMEEKDNFIFKVHHWAYGFPLAAVHLCRPNTVPYEYKFIVMRSALQIVYWEFLNRFGDSIFLPDLSDLLIWRYDADRKQYLTTKCNISDVFLCDPISFLFRTSEQLAVPIHAIYQGFMYLIVKLMKTMLTTKWTERLIKSRILSIQIALSKLCLHKLLIIENTSNDILKPDCFASFPVNHVNRESTILFPRDLIRVNLNISNVADHCSRKFLLTVSMELLCQLIGPFWTIAKDLISNPRYEIIARISSIVQSCCISPSLENGDYVSNSDHINLMDILHARWKNHDINEIDTLLTALDKITYYTPRSHLGALKFSGVVRTHAVRGIFSRKIAAAHEDLLYDALHMQLPLSLFDKDTFLLHYNDLQMAASSAHPFYGGNPEYPWFYFFGLKENTERIYGSQRIFTSNKHSEDDRKERTDLNALSMNEKFLKIFGSNQHINRNSEISWPASNMLNVSRSDISSTLSEIPEFPREQLFWNSSEDIRSTLLDPTQEAQAEHGIIITNDPEEELEFDPNIFG